jgi:hypothetical protein
MPPPHDLVPHLAQLRTASPSRGLADEKKPSRAGLTTDVDKAEKLKVSGQRLAASLLGCAPLDPQIKNIVQIEISEQW